LTLNAVQALLNYLKGNQPLDEQFQFHLSEQTNDKVYIDEISTATKKIEITSANILSVALGSTRYMGGDTGHGDAPTSQ